MAVTPVPNLWSGECGAGERHGAFSPVRLTVGRVAIAMFFMSSVQKRDLLFFRKETRKAVKFHFLSFFSGCSPAARPPGQWLSGTACRAAQKQDAAAAGAVSRQAAQAELGHANSSWFPNENVGRYLIKPSVYTRHL